MKKCLRIAAALVVLMSMFTVTVSAKDIHLFMEKGNKYVRSNTKDRVEDTWLITINEPTGDSIYNFVEGETVVGFRMRSTETEEIVNILSDYVTVSRFVTNRAYPYTTAPDDDAPVYMHAQVDSSSELPYVSFDGKWFT